MMDSLGAEDRRSHFVAVAAVAALHLILLQIVYRATLRAPRADDSSDDALVWLRLDRPPQPRQVERQEVRRSFEPARSTRSVPTQEKLPLEPSTTESSSPRQIDWRGNAARSAQLAVEGAQEEQYRSFGPRKQPPPAEPPPPSMFSVAPKPKYGDVGEVNGAPVVWMSENCYTTLDPIVTTARDAVIASP